MKVLWLTSLPSPYRVDFFNLLGESCDLTVCYEAAINSEREKSWINLDSTHFHSVFLKHIEIKGVPFCPGFPKYITRDFDVVLISNYICPTAVWAIGKLRRLGIPYFIVADGAYIHEESKPVSFLKRKLMSKAAYFLSSGAVTTRYFMYYGVQREQIYEYHFTSLWQKDILLEPPAPQEKRRERERLGITESQIVLSVGQFVYRKGYDVLLSACEGLPDDMGIYIVGGNPTEEYLRLKEEKNLEHVHFVGFQSKEELAGYYRAADCFALPTREDIWGLVVNEAMGYGLPVVTTDRCVAGLELVKNGENGYLVPAGQPGPLREAMMRVLSDPDLQWAMARGSLRAVSPYTLEQMAREHIEIFQEVQDKKS